MLQVFLLLNQDTFLIIFVQPHKTTHIGDAFMNKRIVLISEMGGCRVAWFFSPYVVALTVVFLTTLFVPSFTSSEIYKWKDRDGNVVFSDSPPPGSNAEEVRLKNNMRFEKPRSLEDADPKTIRRDESSAVKKQRDAGDIHVVMYMTDW